MKISNYLKQKFGQGLHLLSGISASVILLTATSSGAQTTSEIIKGNSHLGGYHIKCNGQSTGILQANASFGTEPYTYLWNTGETTAIITDKPAGVYFVTVIDANNNMQTDTFELIQPRAFSFENRTSDYNGYQVSPHGNNNGSIEIMANGGTPPYQYLWSNGDSSRIRTGLTAGNYDFVITDANECSTAGNVVAAEPLPIQVNFNNIQATSCFGGNDGKASLQIAGGLGDYSVVWENGNFSFNPDNLSAGYNTVRIYEQGKAIMDTGIIINQPNKIEIQFNLSNYNGFNVSCVDCFNGDINTNVTGGTAPYSYQWDDINNSTSSNLTNLNGGEYKVIITDVHGCKSENEVRMSMPISKDWSRFGNSNIAASEFIGSTDNSALIFKSNNQEAFSIKNDTITFEAKIKLLNLDSIMSFSANSKLIGMDEDGNLKAYQAGEMLQGSTLPPACIDCGCSPVLSWGKPSAVINGTTVPLITDDIVKCPAEGNVGIGTTNPNANSKLDLIGEIAISGERLNVSYNGNVGVGTSNPDEKLQLFGGNFKVTCPWDYQNPVFFVDHANKNAGVGTGAPRGKFEIKMSESDHISFGKMRTEVSGWATSYIGLNAYREDSGIWKTTGDASNSGGSVIYSNSFGDLMFTTINGENAPYEVGTTDGGVKSNTKMTLTNNGILGIGVNPKDDADLLSYRLVVDGNIKCKKLRVDLQNWGDYVFESNYELMDLNSIEKYIAKNKHLPGMPSANEVEKEGIDLGEMVKLQQVKIEELTLLMIKMQKQIELSSKNK